MLVPPLHITLVTGQDTHTVWMFSLRIIVTRDGDVPLDFSE